MKKILLILVMFLVTTTAGAQILNPVKWSYAAKRVSKTEAVVLIKASIDQGWHLYSQFGKQGGPVSTSFTFSPSPGFTLLGKTIEPKPISRYEETFKMNVSYFEKEVVFQQKIKLNAAQTLVKGTLEFMVCNDQKCLPPDEVSFSIPVK